MLPLKMRGSTRIAIVGKTTLMARLPQPVAKAAGFREGTRVFLGAANGVVVVLRDSTRLDSLTSALDRLLAEVRAGSDCVCPSCLRFHVASSCEREP